MGWFKKLTGISTESALGLAATAGLAYATGGSSLAASSASGGNLFGSLVSGAVGLGEDYLKSQQNLTAQKDLAAYTAGKQNELNEAAYQRNLQQWNLENAYNSPAEQMKRYEEAGLNRNLIYGQQNTAANSPTLQPATYDPGSYHPVDKSAQRQALQLALLEHSQRIENQAIQNDLARQRIALAQRASDRADALADAHIFNTTASKINLTNPVNSDKLQRELDHDYDMRVKQWKLAEELHKKNLSFKQAVRNKLGMRNYDDDWYKKHPQPLRELTGQGKLRYYGRRT